MWLRDLKYAFRRLSRSPGFTLVAVLSLGIGIGANTAIFTLFSNVFLVDAGIEEPETIVRMTRVVDGDPYWRVSWGDYRALLEEGGGAFEKATAWREAAVRTSVSGDQPVPALRVSGDFFGTFGATLSLGRGFIPGEETDVEPPITAAVVSNGFWRSAMNASPDAIGSEIRVDGQPVTVVGVTQPGFYGVSPAVRMDLFIPDPEMVGSPSNNLYGSARLADGVTLERARAAVDAIAARINETRPETLSRRAYTLTPRDEISLDPKVDQAARSDGEARKSIWIGALTYVPVSVIFCLIGTALWMEANSPEASILPAGIEPENLLLMLMSVLVFPHVLPQVAYLVTGRRIETDGFRGERKKLFRMLADQLSKS